MTFRSMLDCWASLRICRAGGEWDAPTLDAALGTEELQREWIAYAEATVSGWADADSEGELRHDEALALGTIQALRVLMESGAPKRRGGRDRMQQAHHKFGDKGGIPSVMEAGLIVDAVISDCAERLVLAEGLSAQDKHEADAELSRRAKRKAFLIGECIMHVHPRKGPYSGLTSGNTARWRHDSRYRRVVSELCRFESSGALVPQKWPRFP